MVLSRFIPTILFIFAIVCFGLSLFDVPIGKLSLDTAGFLFTALGLAFWAGK